MNARLFTMALLMSALPYLALADYADIQLDEGDFVSAEKLTPTGETLVRVKLSKSGKAKIKRLQNEEVGSKVRTKIGETSREFILREPLGPGGLEMGPYSAKEARQVIEEINR